MKINTRNIPTAEAELEKVIVLSGADKAPRLTPEHIEAQIVNAYSMCRPVPA